MSVEWATGDDGGSHDDFSFPSLSLSLFCYSNFFLLRFISFCI